MTNIDKDLPYKVRQAIDAAHQAQGENDACDHRPTYQGALDLITERMTKQYRIYEELIKNISPDDIERARKLCKLEYTGWGLGDDYVIGILLDRWCLMPRYMQWYDKMVKLKMVLA
jgi:hypothetical protein